MQETKDPIILLNIVVRILPWWHHGVSTKHLRNYLLLVPFAIIPNVLLMFWYSNVRITSLFYNSAWSYFALNFKKYTNLVPRKKVWTESSCIVVLYFNPGNKIFSFQYLICFSQRLSCNEFRIECSKFYPTL